MKKVLKIAGEKCLYTVCQSVGTLFGNQRLARQLVEKSESLPKSNGTRYYPLLPYKIGMISDPFLYYDYQDTCDLRYIGPDTAEEALCELDLLLIASVWHGLYGEWTGAGKEGTQANLRLHEIARQCRRKNIPVAFYSKEDPPNFEYFKNLAEDADYIFTSAEELIETYQRMFPGKPIFHLPFCTNPRLYHPVGGFIGQNAETGGRASHTAVFAGSWMPKYPKRIHAQENLFRWCHQEGLDIRIIDRNYSRNNPRYCYPVRYWPLLLPDMDYRLLGGVYKLHDYVLNLNSVTESGSMFAKRVYDALACGSVVLSNESRGMERIFPEVAVIRDPEDLARVLSESAELRHRRRLDGIRRVMSGNTSHARIRQLLTYCGFSLKKPEREIAVIISPETEYPDKVREMFHRQTYPAKRLIDVQDTQEDTRENMIHSCNMTAVWTDCHEYGPHFLEDLINAFKYTACRYVTGSVGGAGAEMATEVEHVYVEEIRDKYAVVFWRTDDWSADLTVLPDAFPLSGGYRIHQA